MAIEALLRNPKRTRQNSKDSSSSQLHRRTLFTTRKLIFRPTLTYKLFMPMRHTHIHSWAQNLTTTTLSVQKLQILATQNPQNDDGFAFQLSFFLPLNFKMWPTVKSCHQALPGKITESLVKARSWFRLILITDLLLVLDSFKV